ncbi:MAG: hypothetical protein ACKOSQ_02285 [Planctomycetaceae bacterium]
MTAAINVLCMKWGRRYGPEYVNNLLAGVTRHLDRPFRFICFTDDDDGLALGVDARPLPDMRLPPGHSDTRWRKLALFHRDLADLRGTALFLDLDQVIVGDLSPFVDLPGDFLIIRDDDLFRPKLLRRLNPARDRFLHGVGNSSVFRFEIGAHAYILDAFLADPAAAVRRYEISQQFQSAELARRGHLRYWPEGLCVSFKNHCVPRHFRSYLANPRPPQDARIVVFAGTPKMAEVLEGRGHCWHRRIGNVDWLREAWSCPT